ncbi:MAG: glycoside hydrolase family 32 protein [Bacilli bacterium]
MNKKISLIIPLLLLTSCSSSSNAKNELLNGGFEDGSLLGWKATGNAYSLNSVQIADDSAITKRHVVGNFFLDGYQAGDSATGTLTSSPFKLKKNGVLSLLIGGGRYKDKVYVSVIDASTNEEVYRITNKFFNEEAPNDRLYRLKVNLNKYLNKELYLKIVDNDNGTDGFNHILLDDVLLDYEGSEDIGTLLEDARNYVSSHAGDVGDTYRHTYHLMPDIGWMNDPNGLCYYDGYYHLFYQHNPYSPNWDTMHWGHARSRDLVKWEYLPVAFAPDKSYDSLGVFSGGALTIDDKLYVMYTAVGPNGVQQQAIATSFDGVNFTKRSKNPVIDSSMRQGSRITDFRDPYVYEKDGKYYALVGGKNEGPGGKILLYESNDFLSWKYLGTLVDSTITNTGMFECPNYVEVGGKDIILSSPQSVRNEDISIYQNMHSVTYQIGHIDYTNGTFTNDNGTDYMEEFDKGFDFYATQTLNHDDEAIMLAWMNMWSRSYPSSVDGWTGEVTLPRTLELKDNHLYQKPISAIKNYFVNEQVVDEISLDNNEVGLDFSGNTLTFKAEIDVSELNGTVGFKLLKGEDEETNIYYDSTIQKVVFDRRNSGRKISTADDDGELDVRYASITPIDNKITLEIYVDVSSVEVFINDGYYTMSGLVYPTNNELNYSVYSTGKSKITNLIKNTIEVL